MAWSNVLLWINIVVFLLQYQVSCETCLPSWISYKQSCVKKYYQELNYQEAKEQCVERGSRLIVKVPEELAVLLNGSLDDSTGFWVSLHLEADTFPTLVTLEQVRKKRQATDDDDDYDICYYLEGTHVLPGYCHESKGFVCEKDFMLPPTACLQSSANNTEKNDWYTARQYCQCNGSDLYSYQDQREEQVALEDAIGRQQVWIGLSREADSNVFRWSDGSPLTYTNWSPGQLETNNNETLCVAHTVQDLKWEVADCSLNLFYMCKPAKSCENDTCNNRGSCSQDSVSGDISCSCDHGYRGDFCDERITCDIDTCKNGGFCSQDDVHGVFRCSCVHGYRGLTCEERITCDNDTCKNEGFCSQDGANGVFRCSCVHGYKGLTCEEKIMCGNDTCKNGGFCSQDGVNGIFRCSCVHGYTGQTCDEKITCDNNTCSNGGSCFQDRENGVFGCSCAHGYTGPTCDGKIVCADDTCNNKGKCSQVGLNGVFRCSCDHGYGGPTCNEKTLDREDKSRHSVPSTQNGGNEISNCTSNPDCTGHVSSERIGGACSFDSEYIYVAAAILGTTILIIAILATTACLITWTKKKSRSEEMQIKLRLFQPHTDGFPTEAGENPV